MHAIDAVWGDGSAFAVDNPLFSRLVRTALRSIASAGHWSAGGSELASALMMREA